MRSPPGAASRRRPASRPWTRPGCLLYISGWFALFAPKGTPKPVTDKLNAAVVDALGNANVRARLADLGQEIPPPEQQTPQALAAFHRAEVEKVAHHQGRQHQGEHADEIDPCGPCGAAVPGRGDALAQANYPEQPIKIIVGFRPVWRPT